MRIRHFIRGGRFRLLTAAALAWVVAFHVGKSGESFLPVETSKLLSAAGSPPPFLTEFAFPHLQFRAPVQAIPSRDGTRRVFVATQGGKIFVFPDDPEVTEARLFLDLSERVHPPRGDNGLFGIALHPQFSRNGRFFVIHNTARPKATVLLEFSVPADDPDRADPDSGIEILRVEQPYPDHNACCIRFGPDGFLHVALGDGGFHLDNDHAQDLSSLLGSMLRIDVDRKTGDTPYAIPRDNPFIGRENVRPEIWAFGLRAPWRFSFDRLTGDCWLGDNGQVGFEEIDLILPGANYGWMHREGRHAFDPAGVDSRGRPLPGVPPRRSGENRTRNDASRFTDPVLEYDHFSGKSVVGGFVYRGDDFPELRGCYLYGDYAVGRIWALRWNGNEVVENRLIAKAGFKITSIEEDATGDPLITGFDGRLHRLGRSDARSGQTAPVPSLLSETGLFRSLHPLTPGPGLIPYRVNVPLWSDGADKERYLALPRAGSVTFRREGAWEFPEGTVFIKSFRLPDADESPPVGRLLETRLLVRCAHGWEGFTYLWNAEQTEASLLDGATTRTYSVETGKGVREQTWDFPSRADCVACHTPGAGFVLGMRTRQVNRTEEDGGNQLERFQNLGLFTAALPENLEGLPSHPDWESESGTSGELARAYLDANCMMCHLPPGFTQIDLRVGVPLDEMFLLNREPGKSRLGPADSRLLIPGHPDRSELFLRMAHRGTGQMPNLATNLPDRKALRILREWILSLEK